MRLLGLVYVVQALVRRLEEVVGDLDVVAVGVVEGLHWIASWQSVHEAEVVVPEAH